jgi:hypothetical protein
MVGDPTRYVTVFPEVDVAVTFAGVSPQTILVGLELKVAPWPVFPKVIDVETEAAL